MDNVAVVFLVLTIIGANLVLPWKSEMIAIAVHKANVYVDLSGWSPKYFPEELKREIGYRLQDKAMFGTDYPYISPRRWLDDFDALGLKDEVRPKILRDNAVRALGLDA